MSKQSSRFHAIKSVAEYHQLLGLKKPEHPLVSIVDFSKVDYNNPALGTSIILDLYCISIKQGANCILKYGPQTYDFGEGVMFFIKPGQVLSIENAAEVETAGYMLTFHQDFLQSFILSKKIRSYDFFDYAISEALFLSEKEKRHINVIMADIEQEYHTNIDAFSQEAVISYIELLLVYANRYYNRQFITRKLKNDTLYLQFEQLLREYFTEDGAPEEGLPTVQYFAERLHMSPNYLSDMLKVATGKSAQSHIQEWLIDVAKTMISTTNLSVAEIAYQLGFERPQSLSRLFKRRTDLSPLEYRASFN